MDAEHTSNGSATPALRIQFVNASERRQASLAASYLELFGLGNGRGLSEGISLHRTDRGGLSFPCESASQLGMMARQDLLQRLAEIV